MHAHYDLWNGQRDGESEFSSSCQKLNTEIRIMYSVMLIRRSGRRRLNCAEFLLKELVSKGSSNLVRFISRTLRFAADAEDELTI